MARALRIPKVRVPTPKIPRLPNTNEPYEDVFEEMTLAEHLDELRSRIVKSCVSIAVGFIGGVIFAGPLLRLIVKQAQAESEGGFDIRSPTDPISIYFKIALYIAIAFATPVLLWQIIGFLAPGLTRKEKRLLFTSLPFVSLLFVAGSSYAFFFAAPRAFQFLSSFQAGSFQWQPDGPEVISFYLTLMIGLGIAFELPAVMFVIAKLNIVSAKKMSEYRRYAFVLVLVASAIITPSTDPINMAIVAVPLYILYELGLILGRIFTRKKPEIAS
ncbi:MAG: sec-independent protein translocase protein TatC [Thermomicrobiales bacterium]|jgi:sec-independent protein translocase protein TatC|nr:sec-independent protein translocase protein TatC [Thermomicrobiales bacterium]MEA2527405.1 sec-independent protein translocase protein TatC [Thermomicrobiales bacterium]MEA2586423.1 sec-independent protein translocase protein TatC [Thermomicrobiales bacterium]MEA2595803.1 sec-independent protein translocase protein TatC [Thermomicrobiales bacterium]